MIEVEEDDYFESSFSTLHISILETWSQKEENTHKYTQELRHSSSATYFNVCRTHVQHARMIPLSPLE